MQEQALCNLSKSALRTKLACAALAPMPVFGASGLMQTAQNSTFREK